MSDRIMTQVNSIQGTPKDNEWYWLNPAISGNPYNECIQWDSENKYWHYIMLNTNNELVYRDVLVSEAELYQ